MKEKWRGSSSGIEMPQVGQPYRSEKTVSTLSLVWRSTSTSPSASFSAVSMESVSAAAIFGAHDESVDDNFDRVVLAPIELRRVGDLDQLTVDKRADESLLAHGSRTDRGTLPFVPARAARRTSIRVPSRPGEDDVGDLRRRSAAATGRPQFGQCGVPTRA